MKWYFKCLKQYVDFSGRARRKEYWMFVLFNLIVFYVLFIVDYLIGTKIPYNGSQIGIISSVYSLAVFLPGLAVTVRRLHDIGKSGWKILWIPLFTIVGAIIGSIVGAILLIYHPVIGAILPIIFTVIAPIIFIIVWMCKNSQPGDNKWGANPKMA